MFVFFIFQENKTGTPPNWRKSYQRSWRKIPAYQLSTSSRDLMYGKDFERDCDNISSNYMQSTFLSLSSLHFEIPLGIKIEFPGKKFLLVRIPALSMDIISCISSL